MTEIEELTQRVETLESTVWLLVSEANRAGLDINDAKAIAYASMGVLIAAWLIYMARKTLD